MGFDLTLTNVATVIGECTVIGGVLTAVIVQIKNLRSGILCLLRNDMLQIYYKYEAEEKIPQYQFENFMAMYKAYKALRGNTFIDKIYKDILSWEVVSRIASKK